MRKGRSVFNATHAELTQIGKLDSPLGAAALALAARIDAGEDPGSAMAAMTKELRVTMTELTARAPAAKDPVDELQKRRAKRLGA